MYYLKMYLLLDQIHKKADGEPQILYFVFVFFPVPFGLPKYRVHCQAFRFHVKSVTII